MYRYIANNLGFLRVQTGDPALPVLVIGGAAPRLRKAEAMAVSRAALDG